MMESAHVVFVAAVLIFTAIAAILDARWKKLPNVFTVTAFVLGILFNAVRGALTAGWGGAGQGLAMSAGGFALGFGTLLVLWLIGGGGGGDVKFMGALGAWLGPWLTLVVLVAATLVAAAFSVLVLAKEFTRLGLSRAKQRYLSAREPEVSRRRQPASELASRQRAERRRLLPFGLPVALATWVLFGMSWITGWPRLPV